ncbi:MAG TPA: LacI family DNA-binding transcriptional regulator [Chloroflexota bacterium]|nr:LacI family DNA-binding transcriptional regulator [Chloroflexota bacterium]
MGAAPPANPTIKDIAARAGVSISTVHYALNRTRPISDETRRRVLAAVHELDYHPHAGAATLPSGRTGRLAVVIGGIEPAFANTYFSDFIRGLAAAAEEEDHTVVLYTAYGRRAGEGWRPAHILRRREADGVLLVGTQISEDHLGELADLGRPAVVLNREHAALPWVIADRRQGARLATEHLLALGRRRVGLLAASYRGGAPLAGRPELSGFREAFAARGLESESELERFVPVGDAPGAAEAEAAAGALIESLRDIAPNGEAGLVLFSYTLAPAAVRAIDRSGVRVPEELAFVMGDEDPDARDALGLPATTVQARKFEMAQAAARLLLRLVRREEIPDEERRQQVPMELKVRWSCGARPPRSQ